jgi:hypothetical protein
MAPGPVRALFGAGLLAGAGCSTVMGIDADRYVAVDKDAAADASAEDPRDAALETTTAINQRDGGVDAAAVGPWDCLNQPPEKLDPDLHVDVKVQVMDAIQPSTAAGAIDGGSDLDTVTGDWLPGVSVRVCTVLDPDCQNASKPVLTNEAGIAEFDLTGDFSGFFDLRRSDLVPATLYPGHLLAGQMTASVPAYGIRPTAFQALAMSADTTVILGADAGVTIYDCQDHQASGVSLTYSPSDPGAVPFYFYGGLPSAQATETDGYGLGGIVNVPTGTLMVKATLASNMTPVGSAAFDVRPGALTFAWIRARSH